MEVFTLRIMRQENPNVLVHPADETYAPGGNYQLHHFYTFSSTDGHHFQPQF